MVEDHRPSYKAKHIRGVEQDINRIVDRIRELEQELADMRHDETDARALLQFLKKNGDSVPEVPVVTVTTKPETPVGTPVRKVGRFTSDDDYKAAIDLLPKEFTAADVAELVGVKPSAAGMKMKSLVKGGYLRLRRTKRTGTSGAPNMYSKVKG